MNFSTDKREQYFTVVCYLFAFSLFFRQSVSHAVFALFLIGLVLFRPRLPWIPAIWFLLAFDIWQLTSHVLGPYPMDGMEGMGMLYHWLVLFLPYLAARIQPRVLFFWALAGSACSATLMWLQWFIGHDFTKGPWRIDPSARPYQRVSGFNQRAWESGFIQSLHALVVAPFFRSRNWRHYLYALPIGSGILLTQIRALAVAFGAGLVAQKLLPVVSERSAIRRQWKPIVGVFTTVLVVGVAIFVLRPGGFSNLGTLSGRTVIWQPTVAMVIEYPVFGIGGGEHFKEEYQKFWDLNPPSKSAFLRDRIGHAHNDWLMLAAHHGIPCLILYLGFLVSLLRFAHLHGEPLARYLLYSVVIFHLVAGMAETYLDYSNTSYALYFVYGLLIRDALLKRVGSAAIPIIEQK